MIETLSAAIRARLSVAFVQRLLGLLLRAVLLYLTCILIRDALIQFAGIDWRSAGKGDVAVDWKAAQLFWRDISPYSPRGLKLVGVPAFGHPPTTPFWFLPLHTLSHAAFGEVLGIISMAMTVAVPAIVIFTLRWPMPYLFTALTFGLVQATPTALEHARVIQISVWIALAYAVAWKSLRRGRDVEAGVALGFACTLKLFPGVMVIYLMLCRRWSAVAAAMISYLCVASVMTARWGLGSWLLFFQQQKLISRQWLTHVRNGSLHGIIRRAFVGLCDKAPVDDPFATTTIAICAALLFGASVWLWHRAYRAQPDTATSDRAFALFSVLSAFLNPWVWEHYFYLLIMPALVALHSVAVDTADIFRRWRANEPQALRPAFVAPSALFALVATGISYLTFTKRYQANTGAHAAACKALPGNALEPVLQAKARYFEIMNWLPWALFLLLTMTLLAYRLPRRKRNADTISAPVECEASI